MMLVCFWSYLTDCTQRVRLDDFLSEVIYCHFGVPQSSHLGPLFFINNVDEVFCICRLVSALGYADEIFMTIESVDDCHRFQSDLEPIAGVEGSLA
jgi:hypothetical protein